MTLSFVIPTYNSIKHIRKCLDSIFTQLPRDTEVIVIDNNSTDFTTDLIERDYPEVRIIRNKTNMGSSRARNQGIEASSGDYIIFMDSDAYLKGGFFSALERILKRIPSYVSSVSPKILKSDSNQIFSCGLYVSLLYKTYDVGQGMREDLFSKPFVVDGPNSCCAVFKREFLEKMKQKRGYFDEDFFFLFEDAEMALRLKERGYQTLFAPELACYHYGNGAGIPDKYRRYLCFRNRLYAILKTKNKSRFASFMLRSLFYDFFRTAHMALTNRHFFKIFKEISRKIEVEKG